MSYEGKKLMPAKNRWDIAAETLELEENGDVSEQVNAWRKAHPDAPHEKQYDYPAAARAGVLSDDSDKEGLLNPDYLRPEYPSGGVYSPADKGYRFDLPKEPDTDSWFNQGIDALDSALLPDESTLASYNPLTPTGQYRAARSATRSSQIVVNSFVDMIWNRPRILRDDIQKSFAEMDKAGIEEYRKSSGNPEAHAERYDESLYSLDSEAQSRAWDNRYKPADVMEPVDMMDQIASDVGAFFVTQRGISKGMGSVKINPAVFNPAMNKYISFAKEAIAAWGADWGVSSAAEWKESLATMLVADMESDDPTSVSEFLESVGVTVDEVKEFDPAETDDVSERLSRFQFEGMFIGLAFTAALKASGVAKSAGSFMGDHKLRNLAETGNVGKSPFASTARTPMSHQRGSVGAPVKPDKVIKEKAKKQGFDTENVYYHRTVNNFDEFKINDNDLGVHVGTKTAANQVTGSKIEPMGLKNATEKHGMQPQTMPLYVKSDNPLRLDDLTHWTGEYVAPELIAKGIDVPMRKSLGESFYHIDDVRKAINDAGYDSIIYKNEWEDVGADSLIIMETKNIRSVNAKFDPKKKASGNLMAGVAGGAVALGATQTVEASANEMSFTEQYHAETVRQGKERTNEDGTKTSVLSVTAYDDKTGKVYNLPSFDRDNPDHDLTEAEALDKYRADIEAGRVEAYDTIDEAVAVIQKEHAKLDAESEVK